MAFILSLCCSACNDRKTQSAIGDSTLQLTQNDFAIAGLPLGSDSATVIGLIGSPDSIEQIKPSMISPNQGYSTWHYPKYDLIFDFNGKLSAFWLMNNETRTARGLAVGDSLKRVRELYGRNEDDLDLPFSAFIYHAPNNDPKVLIVQIDNGVVNWILMGYDHSVVAGKL